MVFSSCDRGSSGGNILEDMSQFEWRHAAGSPWVCSVCLVCCFISLHSLFIEGLQSETRITKTNQPATAGLGIELNAGVSLIFLRRARVMLEVLFLVAGRIDQAAMAPKHTSLLLSNLWPVVSDQWRWGWEASRSNLDHLMKMFRVYAFILVQSGRLMLLIRGDRDLQWTSRPVRVHVYVYTRLYVYK